MQISVDAGALCSTNKFGTYIFTENIITALSAYDKENSYTAYLYKRAFRIGDYPRVLPKVLKPTFGWMAGRVSIEELIRPNRVYLGLSQSIPWFTRAKVISFLHGLSFFLHKDLYQDRYEALKDQVMFATARSQNIIVSSSRVKRELEEHFGYADAVVLPFGVPFDMEILGTIQKNVRPYFMFVGMNQPIKNIDFLIKAFLIYREEATNKDCELLLVGNHQNLASKENNIRVVSPTRAELKQLYRNANGYLTSSLYESYNLPVTEALLQGCPVIARSTAIIPELRSHVQIADELEDFVQKMKRTHKKRTTINEELIKEFSWRSYVNKLTSLYK